MGIELVFPALDHQEMVEEYLREHAACNERELAGDSGLDRAENYSTWLEKVGRDLTAEITSWIYLAIRQEDGKMLGTINLRFPYEGYVQEYGHVGYGVRPSERGKGYGTQMLKLVLEKAREKGLDKLLLTCDRENVASAKTIKNCGGVLEKEVFKEGGWSQRYWIIL